MKRILNCPMENGSGGMPPKPMEKAKELGPDRIQKQLRVLVIDDSPPILRSVCRILSRGGVNAENLVLASNGSEGLNKISEGEFDLIITDNNMPEMDGQNMVKILAEEGKTGILDKIVLQTAQLFDIKTEVKILLNGRVLDKIDAGQELIELTQHLIKGGAVKDWIPSTEEIY